MKPTQDFRVQVFQTAVRTFLRGAVGVPHLANTTMETFLQNGSTGYEPYRFERDQAGCFNCHNLPSFANRRSPARPEPRRLEVRRAPGSRLKAHSAVDSTAGVVIA